MIYCFQANKFGELVTKLFVIVRWFFYDYNNYILLKCTVLSYEHTERQAAAAVSRSHWNALWRSKIGPRPIPKRHPKRQNFKAAAAAAARCVYTLTGNNWQIWDLNCCNKHHWGVYEQNSME